MTKSELDKKHLAELHALAADAGVERYRMLSRAELVAKLADGAGDGGGSDAPTRERTSASGESQGSERPARRRRSRGGSRRSGGDREGGDSGREPRDREGGAASREPRDRDGGGDRGSGRESRRSRDGGGRERRPESSREPDRESAPEPAAPAPRSESPAESAPPAPSRAAAPPAAAPTESSSRPRRRRRRRFGRRGKGELTLQSLLLPPAGRQAVLAADSREACTALLRGIAADLSNDSKGLDPVALLVDPSPEELADWRRDAPQAEIVAAGQPRHASDALAQAQSRAASGEDVILLVDSLTRLAEAYDDADAAKEFFDAAGGNLTVVAALERPAS